MGFFSSIGSVLGGIGGALLSPFTGGASIGIGAGLGGALGSDLDESKSDARYNHQMSLAQAQMQFQQDYVKNAMQWRAEDAKKAGFHPMAALGFSSPQYSGVSFPSIPGDTQTIDPTEFGQSLNYAATKAKDRKQQEAMIGLQMRGMELDNEYKQAQIDAIKVDTLASTIASDQALTSPPSPKVNQQQPSGMPEPPKPEDLFTFGLDGNGKKTRVYPTDFMTSTWEDRPAGTSLTPLAEAEKLEQDAKLRGTVTLGHVWSPDAEEFVPVGSNAGKRALDYWKRAKSPSTRERIKTKYPREKMNSLDRGFFDWIDRVFR